MSEEDAAEDRSVTISTTLYESELREFDAIRDGLPPGQRNRPGVIRALMRFWREGHGQRKRGKPRQSGANR